MIIVFKMPIHVQYLYIVLLLKIRPSNYFDVVYVCSVQFTRGTVISLILHAASPRSAAILYATIVFVGLAMIWVSLCYLYR